MLSQPGHKAGDDGAESMSGNIRDTDIFRGTDHDEDVILHHNRKHGEIEEELNVDLEQGEQSIQLT